MSSLFARRSRRFETIADDHQTRRLFGGVGDDDDGPMIAQHTNPIAERKREEERLREEAEGANKKIDPALAALAPSATPAGGAKGGKTGGGVAQRFARVPQSALDEMKGIVDTSKSGGSGIDGWNLKAVAEKNVPGVVLDDGDRPAVVRSSSRAPSRAPVRQSSRVPLVPADDVALRARSVERSNSNDRSVPAIARVPSLTPAPPSLAPPRSSTPARSNSLTGRTASITRQASSAASPGGNATAAAGTAAALPLAAVPMSGRQPTVDLRRQSSDVQPGALLRSPTGGAPPPTATTQTRPPGGARSSSPMVGSRAQQQQRSASPMVGAKGSGPSTPKPPPPSSAAAGGPPPSKRKVSTAVTPQ